MELAADEREMDIDTFSIRESASIGNQGAYQPSLDEELDSSDEHDFDPEVTLESIQNSKTINFSIRANYTKWKPREAFRELVQNW